MLTQASTADYPVQQQNQASLSKSSVQPARSVLDKLASSRNELEAQLRLEALRQVGT